MNPGNLPVIVLVRVPLENRQHGAGGMFEDLTHGGSVAHAVGALIVEPLMGKHDHRFVVLREIGPQPVELSGWNVGFFQIRKEARNERNCETINL